MISCIFASDSCERVDDVFEDDEPALERIMVEAEHVGREAKVQVCQATHATIFVPTSSF